MVLYRATGVLNLAYGAIGATGALISWSLLGGVNRWIAYAACIAFGGAITLLYGVLLGPPFAARDPLVKATATIGLLLILLGVDAVGVAAVDHPQLHPADAAVALRGRPAST